MSKLFSPITFKGIRLKNRLIIAPMCQYSAQNGYANDWHLVHLGARALGGASLIIQEATAVSANGRITHQDLGLWEDAQMEYLQKITQFVQQHDAVIGIQLAHAGRKASCDLPWLGGKQLHSGAGSWDTIAPSALPFSAEDKVPLALRVEDIQTVIRDFQSAAQRAVKAGYQLIEIHAAHGYLLHQFLSPLSNQRSDEYGGSLANRMRLCLEVTQAIKAVIPADMPLFVRISATDWKENGWNENEAVELSKALKKLGVDLIHVSSGGLAQDAVIHPKPNYQVPFAAKIKAEADIPTAAVGLILNAEQAEEILVQNQADLIAIARASLQDPNFPLRAAHALKDKVTWPVQYERAPFRD